MIAVRAGDVTTVLGSEVTFWIILVIALGVIAVLVLVTLEGADFSWVLALLFAVAAVVTGFTLPLRQPYHQKEIYVCMGSQIGCGWMDASKLDDGTWWPDGATRRP